MSAYEQDVKDPSLLGVAFCAFAIAALGAFFGFALLASVPVERFRSVADYERTLEKDVKPELLNPHYFEGDMSGPREEWLKKRKIFLNDNDTTLDVSAADINGWVASECSQAQVTFSKGEQSKPFAVLDPPNFFIDVAEGIHFSIPVEVSLFGKKIDYMLTGEGSFLSGNAPAFHLNKLRLNAASVPLPAKLQGRLLEPVFGSFYGSDELAVLKEAWKKVDSVERIEDGIRLNLN